MSFITANVIADSISPEGVRITTLDCIYPRIPDHEQLLTHRAFSRNAKSSRAIRIERFIEEAVSNPVIPIEVRYDEKGMQGYTLLSQEDLVWFTQKWLEARDSMVSIVKEMAERRIHKQTANRLLQPFAHIETIVTATDWQNFMDLRLEHDTQPEMQALARAIHRAMESSTPIHSDLHLPLIDEDEYGRPDNQMVSGARCARVSYCNHGKKNADYEEEVRFAKRLWSSGHLSPFEHSARALTLGSTQYCANFRGWASWRYFNGK